MDLRHQNARPSPAVLAAVERARQWVDVHYREDPSLSTVAEVAGVSPYYFHRVFRAVVGVTVKRYVDGLRWAEVERMVARGAARAEIARRLSFCSGGYVSSRYRSRERGGARPERSVTGEPVQ